MSHQRFLMSYLTLDSAQHPYLRRVGVDFQAQSVAGEDLSVTLLDPVMSHVPAIISPDNASVAFV